MIRKKMPFIRKTPAEIADFKKLVRKSPESFLPVFVGTSRKKRLSKRSVRGIVSDLKSGNF